MIEGLMASFCVLLGIAGSSWIGGLIVFAPLHERTLLFKIQNRFRIADIIALGIMLQLFVGGILMLLPSDEGVFERAMITVLVSMIVLMWWINGLRMLSRAGVESGWHRGAFLTLVLPTGYVSVLIVIATIILFPASMELFSNWSRRKAWEISLGFFLLILPVLGVVWGVVCHRICRSMACRARDDQAKRDGIAFDDVQLSERDPNVTRYLIGRQAEHDAGIHMEDPIVMATSADPPEPTDGVRLLDEDGADAT